MRRQSPLPDRFIAIDVETASRARASVCAVGAARFERGVETASFRSLVQTRGPVRFGSIHGLAAADLAGAPEWGTVWHRLVKWSAGIREFVAYRAEFDRGAILAMCAKHNVKLPPLRFTCAAELIQARFPGERSLREALEALGLPYPGRPHDPLADARAAAAIVLVCSETRPPRGAR
jgi:DNA polymerase-3 subunit epsilon